MNDTFCSVLKPYEQSTYFPQPANKTIKLITFLPSISQSTKSMWWLLRF